MRLPAEHANKVNFDRFKRKSIYLFFRRARKFFIDPSKGEADGDKVQGV